MLQSICEDDDSDEYEMVTIDLRKEDQLFESGPILSREGEFQEPTVVGYVTAEEARMLFS